MKHVLLTGAGGFVGTRIQAQLSPQLRLTAAPRGWIASASREDIVRLMEETHPDAVLHTAALSDTGICEQNPDASYHANVLLSLWIAQAARSVGAKLVAFSSDQVYAGAEQSGPLPENLPLHPCNVYERHKLEAEERVLDEAPDSVLLRASWMYDLPESEGSGRAGLPMQLVRAAQSGKSLVFSRRDYRGVTDVRQAVANLLPAMELPGGVYNFGSENDIDMFATARRFCETLGVFPTLTEGDRIRNLLMDTSKARRGGIVFDATCDGIVRRLNDHSRFD